MDAYFAYLERCAAFFSATAQVSGGLLGLVFVAFTFNPAVARNSAKPALRELAQQTFADFVIVLLISLLMLIPELDPQAMAVNLGIMTLVGLVRLVRSVRRIVGIEIAARDGRHGRILQRFGLSLIAHAGLGASTWLLLQKPVPMTLWPVLMPSTMVLLISGSRSAWLLLHESD